MTRWDWDTFWGATALWLLVAIVALFLAAAAHDGEGRASGDHVGPRPDSVVQLTPSAFLAPPQFDAHRICGGGTDSNGHVAVNLTAQVPDIHRQFVECRDDQHWNSTLPGSLSYWHSYGYMATRPYIWGTLAGLYLLLVLFMFAPMAVGERTYRRKQARERKVSLEDARRELRASYAADEIGPETFERKLQELYGQGLPRE